MKAVLLASGIASAIQVVSGDSCGPAVDGCFKAEYVPTDDFVSNFRYSPDFKEGLTHDGSRPTEAILPPAGNLALAFMSNIPIIGFAFGIASNVLTYFDAVNGAGSGTSERQTQLLKAYTDAVLRDALSYIEEETFNEKVGDIVVPILGALGNLNNFIENKKDGKGERLKDNFNNAGASCAQAKDSYNVENNLEVKLSVYSDFCSMCAVTFASLGRSVQANEVPPIHFDQFEQIIQERLVGLGDGANNGILKACVEGTDVAKDYLNELAARVTAFYQDGPHSCDAKSANSDIVGGDPIPVWRSITIYDRGVDIKSLKSSNSLQTRVLRQRYESRFDTPMSETTRCEGHQNYQNHLDFSRAQNNRCVCRYQERIVFEAYQILQHKVISLAKGLEAKDNRSLINVHISVDSTAAQAYKTIEVIGVDGSKIPILYARRAYLSSEHAEFYKIIDQDLSTFANVNQIGPNAKYGAVFEIRSDIDIAEIRIRLQHPLSSGNNILVNVNRGNGYIPAGIYSGSELNFIVRPSYALKIQGPELDGTFLRMSETNLLADTSSMAIAERFMFRSAETSESTRVNIISLVGSPDCLMRQITSSSIRGSCLDTDHPDNEHFTVLRGGLEDPTYRIRDPLHKMFLRSEFVSGSAQATRYVDNAARIELIPKSCSTRCAQGYSSSNFGTSSSVNSYHIPFAQLGGGFFAGVAIVLLGFSGLRRRRTRSEAKKIKKDLSPNVENDIDPSTDF